jgi:hypothetical protein
MPSTYVQKQETRSRNCTESGWTKRGFRLLHVISKWHVFISLHLQECSCALRRAIITKFLRVRVRELFAFPPAISAIPVLRNSTILIFAQLRVCTRSTPATIRAASLQVARAAGVFNTHSMPKNRGGAVFRVATSYPSTNWGDSVYAREKGPPLIRAARMRRIPPEKANGGYPVYQEFASLR